MLMYTNSKNSFIEIEHRLNYIMFKLKSNCDRLYTSAWHHSYVQLKSEEIFSSISYQKGNIHALFSTLYHNLIEL